jgi:hypothetical protein
MTPLAGLAGWIPGTGAMSSRRAAPVATRSAPLTSLTARLGSKGMDEDELLELEASREERAARFGDALRSVYEELDGEVLSLDDDE